MPNPSFTSNFKRSLALCVSCLALAQFALLISDLPSPTLFGDRIVSQKYDDALRLHAAGRIELVVVGHSHAVLGVDPRQLGRTTGLRSYNFAIPATDVETQAMLVRDFVVPHLRPDVILWHIDPQVQSGYRSNRKIIESDGFQLQRRPLGHYAIALLTKAAPFQKRPLDGWVSALLDPRERRYDRYGFLSSNERYAEKPEAASEPPAERGPAGPQPLVLAHAAQQRSTPMLSQSELRQVGKRRLWRAARQAFRLAERADVAIYAFSAPRHRDSYASNIWFGRAMRAGEFDRDAIRLQRLLADFRVPYANYRYLPAISDDDRSFGDPTHLNRIGAARLTDVLARRLLRGERVEDQFRGVFSRAEKQLVSP